MFPSNAFLRHLDVSSRLICEIEQSGPWSRSVETRDEVQVHLVSQGSCLFRALEMDAAVRLESGDVAILSRGGAATLYVSGDRPDPWASCSLRERVASCDTPLTHVISAALSFNFSPLQSWLTASESPLVIRRRHWIEAGIQRHAGFSIAQAIASKRPACSLEVDRQFEILMIQLFDVLELHPLADAGLRCTQYDKRVARAVAAIHENPGFNWSLERLAEVAGLSRSAFSRHFAQAAGMSAIQYLTAWRMHVAFRKLQGQLVDIEDTAKAVGYLSPTAFQKAFKRVHGITPAQATTISHTSAV
ncbi:MAG: helix-turn-helix transcriptional regulator [Gammaproteobacteria bacterium]|nr:helix-turn-helix transcriptional regulator [Gammaproteobacteria bacterium]